jgi:hypothetical protein
VSTRPTTRNNEKQFIRGLERLDYSRSKRDKFCDLIELAYCAFAKLTAPTVERAAQLEARYMSIVGRYGDKAAIRAYPELLALAMDAVYSERTDFLGRVSSELGVLNAQQGQFFTPYPVALFMARLSMEGLVETVRQKGYVTVQDPAAGAGGLLLAYAQALEDAQFDPTSTLLASAVDVNALAFQMCFLQLTWRGIPALVQRGNSLSREIYESAWTPAAQLFYARHGHLLPADEETSKPGEVGDPTPPERETEQPFTVAQLQLF